jgi:hemerythrin-like domain-containing protein
VPDKPLASDRRDAGLPITTFQEEQMTTVPTVPELIDTREMNVVHSFFRRELRLAGGLVRRVLPGDLRRAAVVGAHLEFVERTLHHHHTAEDELLWPLLLERVPDDLAPIVHLMEAQHEQVDALLSRLGPLRQSWQRTADPALRDELGTVYDQLYVGLVEHLDAEEARLLPLAARCLTQQEWNALGERGRKEGRRSEMSLVFGMLQYDGDPEVVAGMLATAPAPVRVLVPRLARRAFRRHALAVHGTATP